MYHGNYFAVCCKNYSDFFLANNLKDITLPLHPQGLSVMKPVVAPVWLCHDVWQMYVLRWAVQSHKDFVATNCNWDLGMPHCDSKGTVFLLSCFNRPRFCSQYWTTCRLNLPWRVLQETYEFNTCTIQYMYMERLSCLTLLCKQVSVQGGGYIIHPSTPFAVHLRKIYIYLHQHLKLYSKYTFISTSVDFINANEVLMLFAINIQ